MSLIKFGAKCFFKLILLSETLSAMSKLMFQLKTFLNKESYFQNYEYLNKNRQRKSKYKIFFDMYKHALIYGEINEFYFVYGFDYKGPNEIDSYIPYKIFRIKRNLLNLTKPVNYICLLRDKSLFGRIMKSHCLPVVSDLGYIRNGNIYSVNNSLLETDIKTYVGQNAPLFIKNAEGECGKGVYSVDYKNEKIIINNNVCEDLWNVLSTSASYVVQPKVIQHSLMSKLYPHAVNTLRIVTAKDAFGNVDIFSAILRIGANGNNVDNWAKGGLVIGIDSKGCLNKYGFYKPGYGTVSDKHPDTDIIFEGFKVPYYEEVLQLCLCAHNALKNIHSIGWDVAITEEGPVLIEGNDNWEISLMQVCDEGLKDRFKRFFNIKVRPNI